MALCLVKSRCSIETAGRIALVLGIQVFFHLPILQGVLMKFGCLQKKGYFPREPCPKLWIHKNFVTSGRSCFQQNLSTDDLLDDNCSSQHVVAGRTQLIARPSALMLLTPLL